jgi:hypothetical protein
MKLNWIKGLLAIVWTISCLTPVDVFSQKSKFYVLAYKYKPGDKYRVSTSSYSNFTATSGLYNNSYSSETSFDLYQEIEGADDEAYDMKIRLDLTRFTENGKNFTYKLGNMFRGDLIHLSFDRFGKVLPETVVYTAVDTTHAQKLKQSSFITLIFVPLPDRALKIGDTWKVTDLLSAEEINNLAGSVIGISKPDIRGAYTLDSVDAGQARIKLSLEISGNGKPANLREMPELDFLLQINGTFSFNIPDGKITYGSVTTEAVGVTSIGETNVDFKGSYTSVFSVEKYK